jgi:hypothetical protein
MAFLTRLYSFLIGTTTKDKILCRLKNIESDVEKIENSEDLRFKEFIDYLDKLEGCSCRLSRKEEIINENS